MREWLREAGILRGGTASAADTLAGLLGDLARVDAAPLGPALDVSKCFGWLSLVVQALALAGVRADGDHVGRVAADDGRLVAPLLAPLLAPLQAPWGRLVRFLHAGRATAPPAGRSGGPAGSLLHYSALCGKVMLCLMLVGSTRTWVSLHRSSGG